MSAERLTWTLAAAGIPIHGVSVKKIPPSNGDVRVDYTEAATPAQRVAAANLVARFDWSAAAEEAWRDDRDRERASQEVSAPGYGLEGIVAGLMEEINVLRVQAGLAPRPPEYIQDVILDKIATAPARPGGTRG